MSESIFYKGEIYVRSSDKLRKRVEDILEDGITFRDIIRRMKAENHEQWDSESEVAYGRRLEKNLIEECEFLQDSGHIWGISLPHTSKSTPFSELLLELTLPFLVIGIVPAFFIENWLGLPYGLGYLVLIYIGSLWYFLRQQRDESQILVSRAYLKGLHEGSYNEAEHSLVQEYKKALDTIKNKYTS